MSTEEMRWKIVGVLAIVIAVIVIAGTFAAMTYPGISL